MLTGIDLALVFVLGGALNWRVPMKRKSTPESDKPKRIFTKVASISRIRESALRRIETPRIAVMVNAHGKQNKSRNTAMPFTALSAMFDFSIIIPLI